MGNRDFGGWQNLKFLFGHYTFEMPLDIQMGMLRRQTIGWYLQQ